MKPLPSAPSGESSQHSELADLIDEIAEHVNAGEAVDIDHFVNRHPELEQPLRAAFASVVSLREVAQQANTENSEAPPKSLGDYQLLREIGRGGMGVVYEAEQLSLGRTVALKVLPFASVLDERKRRRFHNEARAAASLEHAHIVPVYGSGLERGVHYYAMRLIEGQSLAEVIEAVKDRSSSDCRTGTPARHRASDGQECASFEKPSALNEARQPASDTIPMAALSTEYSVNRESFHRQVAELGIQAAEALHYAHESGVIHRDIKPANLLIDDSGHLWVTDFGLAHVNSEDLTLTGDLMGTLRYMSPEQASGTNNFDGRTDIYSLGATLYELLTLQPAVEGETRQQMMQQLEEQRLTSPRSVDPSIPKDLEKVLLKAMSPEAVDRYESAAMFADDLGRFLDHKPVRATRTGHFHRLVRWTRRHRLVAALVGVVLMLLLTLSIAGPIVAIRFQRLAKSEHEAKQAAKETNQTLIEMLGENLDTTTQALENIASNEYIHEKLITDTIAQYERLLQQDASNTELRFGAAKAYHVLSWVAEFRFGIDSKRWVQESRKILESLVAEHPDRLEYQDFLASVYWQIAHEGDGRIREYAERSVQMAQRIVDLEPDNPTYLCHLGVDLGSLATFHWEQGNREEGLRTFARSERVFESLTRMFPEDDYRCGRAFFLTRHANMLSSEGRHAEAEPLYRQALAIYGDFSNTTLLTRFRIGHGGLLRQLGDSLNRLGHVQEAEQYLRQSVAELKEVTHGFPKADWATNELNVSRLSLIDNLIVQQRLDEALSTSRQALTEWKAPIRDRAWIPKVALHRRLACILWWLDKRVEASGHFQKAVGGAADKYSGTKLWMWTRCPDPSFHDPQAALALAEADPENSRSAPVGIAHYRLGSWQQAHDLFAGKVADRIADAFDHFFLAMCLHQLGKSPEARVWYEKGLEREKQPQTWNERLYWHELQSIQAEAADTLGAVQD